MKVSVRQGQIHVSSVCLMTEGPGCYVFAADCRAKYPEVMALSGNSVYLSAGKETLRAEDTEKITEISFDGLAEGNWSWTVDAVAGRYTVMIYLWAMNRDPDKAQVVWEDEP